MKTGIHITLARLMERGRFRDDRLLVHAASGNRAAGLAAAKTYGADAVDSDIMARLTRISATHPHPSLPPEGEGLTRQHQREAA